MIGKINDLTGKVNELFRRMKEINDKEAEELVLKYQTLILPIKSFYTETQREIEEHPNDFYDNVQDINSERAELGNKKQVVLDLDGFADDVEKSWKNGYTEYFDKTFLSA